MKIEKFWPKALLVAGLALGLLAVGAALAGCASPGEMTVDPTTGKAVVTRVDYMLPFTGVVLFSVEVDPTQAQGSLLGVALKAGGLLLASRLGLSTVTRSGRANWGVIADGDASWKGTGAAILHNTLGTSSPVEALAKLPNPNRSDP